MYKNPTSSKENKDLDYCNWEEVYERVRYERYYLGLPNLLHTRAEKWRGLKSLGYSEEQCEKLCKPVEFDREEMLQRVAEISKAHQKELNKLNPKPKCK